MMAWSLLPLAAWQPVTLRRRTSLDSIIEVEALISRVELTGVAVLPGRRLVTIVAEMRALLIEFLRPAPLR
jgi:hypothetical protein